MSEAPETTVEPTEQVAAPTSVQDLQRKMKLKGTVKAIQLYGAFLDVGVGTPAILHISQIPAARGKRLADVMNVGDEVEVYVDRVEEDGSQFTVTMSEPLAVEWGDLEDGQTFTGRVTRLENFGAFVNIGAEKDGLVHVSELSHDYINHPSQVITVGDEVEVKVLSFNRRKRRINLSIKALQEQPESAMTAAQANVAAAEAFQEDQDMPTAMEIALRRAMSSDFSDDDMMEMEEFGNGRGKKKKKSRKQRGARSGSRRRSREQADILSRTLEYAIDD